MCDKKCACALNNNELTYDFVMGGEKVEHVPLFYLLFVEGVSRFVCVLMVQREEKFRSVLHADTLVLLVEEFVRGKIW